MWPFKQRRKAKRQHQAELGGRQRRLTIETLEHRKMLAAYNLTTGNGDGNLQVGVDGFGAFGSAAGADTTNAFYDPIGSVARAGTTFESAVAVRIGASGARQFLSSGGIGSTGLTNPVVTGTATRGVSTFTYRQLSFTLTQTVAPLRNTSGARIGSVLTQTYVMRNNASGTLNFEMVR